MLEWLLVRQELVYLQEEQGCCRDESTGDGLRLRFGKQTQDDPTLQVILLLHRRFPLRQLLENEEIVACH